jgi:hypothetical protein
VVAESITNFFVGPSFVITHRMSLQDAPRAFEMFLNAKSGTLKSGKGRHPKVKSRKQAIAIGLSEARKKGAKVPRRSKSS